MPIMVRLVGSLGSNHVSGSTKKSSHPTSRDKQSGLLSAWREGEVVQHEHNETRRKMYREELQLWEVKRDQEEVEPIGQNRSMVGWSGQFQSPSSMVEVQKGEGNNVVDGEDSDNEDDVQSNDN